MAESDAASPRDVVGLLLKRILLLRLAKVSQWI